MAAVCRDKEFVFLFGNRTFTTERNRPLTKVTTQPHFEIWTSDVGDQLGPKETSLTSKSSLFGSNELLNTREKTLNQAESHESK